MSEQEYVSGGYYLARRLLTPTCMSLDLLPSHILSASECISDFFPDCWAIEWASETAEERIAHASHFGIAPGALPDVTAWATDAFGKSFGWPNVFYTLEAAREARARFLAVGDDVVLFGLGLHKSLVAQFLEYSAPALSKTGCAPVGETGIFHCVNAARFTATGGNVAGYELLATYFGLLTCSWLCNGLEKDCAQKLGIRPNRHGFIETLDEAMRCTEFVAQPDIGAEPGLWLPWLITKYSV